VQREGRAPLEAPCSSDAPLTSAPAVLAFLSWLSLLGAPLPLRFEVSLAWLQGQADRPAVTIALAVALSLLWSWLLARPQRVAREARLAGLAPPTAADWRAAAITSAYFVLGAALLHAVASSTRALVDGLAVIAATAVVLDLFAAARAHRDLLAPAAVLHQVQRAPLVEHLLAGAGIPCHLQARHLRALLGFFGPHVPIVALVPAARAEEARALIAEALRTPASAPPVARVAKDGASGYRTED
jgi:hypothetical protein